VERPVAETHFVERDGLTFHCRIDGAEAGPWIVFSNSLATDLTVWDAQVDVLKDRFRILRYDQRGHGRTSVPAGPCDFEQLGGDLIALLDHFDIRTCTFVGLSMGCPTGLHLILRQPARVEKLVLVDGQAETAPTGAAGWEQRIMHARTAGMGAVAGDTVARWFSPEFVAAGGAERLRAGIAAMAVDGYVACARALQSYAYRPVLGTIQVPTLLVAGANDGNMPVSMEAMSRAIPGARFVAVPQAGHIPNLEQASAFNLILLDFLA
jgi:3-oxoadipate enol-lactonase